MIVITGRRCRIAPINGLSPRLFDEEIDGDRSSSFARSASLAAWKESFCDAENGRIGSTVTASKLGLGGLLSSMRTGRKQSWIDFIAPQLAPSFVEGPVTTTIGACATGLSSWIRAAQLLENDEADAVFAGAAEGALDDFVVSGFRRMGVISNTLPRPFDRRRDGFTPAEGVGVVVMEREEDARARGANIYGRLIGWALSADIRHAIESTPDGSAIVRVMTKALRNASITRGELAYIHLHGTGTRGNDRTEAAALRHLFDEQNAHVPASSTKGETGHCLGAAGAVEALITLDALSSGMAPGTTGLEEIDDECRSDCIIRNPTKLAGKIGVVLSYGFGGHLAAIVVEGA